MPLGVLVALVFALGALRALPAQKSQDDEVQKLTKQAPITENDPEVMKALGVEAYAPFAWADGLSTSDVDKVLGEGRILWIETAHFRIGSNLVTSPWPKSSNERKQCRAECERLNDRCREFPKRPKKLTPWVRLHLYAQRCEQAYAEFQQLVGVTDADEPFLGSGGKFLLLCFQKKSDMARYMQRFCDLQVDDSMRAVHKKTDQMLMCMSAEGLDGFDAQGLHAHVLHGVWYNLVNGFRGYRYPLPQWLGEGLAHYYARRVESQFVNVPLKDSDSVSRDDMHKWSSKVSRRAQHEGAFFPFEAMAAWDDQFQLGYHEHTQSWSRVDFLMHLDPQKVGEVIHKAKGLRANGDWAGQGRQALEVTKNAVYALFEFDGPGFDAAWRDWVLKVYPKRKD